MEQATMQCPNCKFYKVDTEGSYVEIGRKPDPQIGGAILMVVIGFFVWLFGGLVVVYVGGGIISTLLRVVSYQEATNILCIIWTLACLVFVICGVIGALKETIPVNHCKGFFCTCRHCGYEWFE